MPRTPQGWKLETDPRSGIRRVRFTHAGRQRKLSTGERSDDAASPIAARIFAEVVSGRRRPASHRTGAPRLALDELAAAWLASVEATLDPTTVAQYVVYARAHFVPFFGTLDRVTSASAADYVRIRLRRVKRRTLLKELSALRGLLAWCEEKGYLDEVPTITSPPRRVTGTPDQTRNHKVDPIPLDEQEVGAIIHHLPERSRKKLLCRSYYEILWQTGLRPSTVQALRVPDDFVPGSSTLKIRDEADKARWGREVVLSERAATVLTEVVPNVGVIFGRHSMLVALRRAATNAGLPQEKAAHLSDRDFRHARLTFLAQHTQNLAGIAYLAGHKHMTTTSAYVHPGQRAAREVLKAVVGAEYQPHISPKAEKQETPNRANLSVRKGGLEPPSPFGHRNLNGPCDPPNHGISSDHERQEASGDATQLPGSSPGGWNPGSAEDRAQPAADLVGNQLDEIRAGWHLRSDRRELRRSLIVLLGQLEASDE